MFRNILLRIFPSRANDPPSKDTLRRRIRKSNASICESSEISMGSSQSRSAVVRRTSIEQLNKRIERVKSLKDTSNATNSSHSMGEVVYGAPVAIESSNDDYIMDV